MHRIPDPGFEILTVQYSNHLFVQNWPTTWRASAPTSQTGKYINILDTVCTVHITIGGEQIYIFSLHCVILQPNLQSLTGTGTTSPQIANLKILELIPQLQNSKFLTYMPVRKSQIRKFLRKTFNFTFLPYHRLMSFLRVCRTDVDWNADNGQFTLLQYAAHQVHYCTPRFLYSSGTFA